MQDENGEKRGQDSEGTLSSFFTVLRELFSGCPYAPSKRQARETDKVALFLPADRAAGRHFTAPVDVAAVQADPGVLFFGGKQPPFFQKLGKGAEAVAVGKPSSLAMSPKFL